MTKWADYLIYTVHYNDDHDHIESVKAFEDNSEDKVGPSHEFSRATVISSIETGISFVTIYKGNDGKWLKGEDVRIVEVNNEKYIRTDANNKAADNLGNLPEY